MTVEKPGAGKQPKPDMTKPLSGKKGAKREHVLSGQPNEHIQQLLLDGEEIIRVATIHPGIYWKGIAVLILALILLVFAFNLGVLMLIVSAIMLVVAHLTKHFLLLALTNKRVLIRYGVIKLDVIQIHHRKIESVELAWTIMGQLMGYASVMITGTGSRVSIVPFIANAPQFRKELENILVKIDDRIIGGAVKADSD
jgi:hypothetical protein